jgi:hypothetical protein
MDPGLFELVELPIKNGLDPRSRISTACIGSEKLAVAARFARSADESEMKADI